MRSYYDHLTSIAHTTSAVVQKKPVFRSSAIFPVISDENIHSRVLFMGYWALKRKITEIAVVYTLRSMDGTIVYRSNDMIREPITYRIEIDQLVEQPFSGSIEVEFYSAINLVFPFPALVINYYGKDFSSVVHTAQRVYNDYDDRKNNSQSDVPEAGFNIYADEDKEPFLGVVNGGEEIAATRFQLEVINHEQQVMHYEWNLGQTNPYQTHILYPARDFNLKKFLNGRVGTAKAWFHLKGVYPRMIVGNIEQSLNAIGITHTYYDCSTAQSDKDYWIPMQAGWHPAALMVPVTVSGTAYTKVYFYPIYSPSTLRIDVEIYDPYGHLLGLKEGALLLESPSNQHRSIDLKAVVHELNITETRFLGARIIAHPINSDRIPTRIKLGLDLGQDPIHLPCNICTNLQPFNPAVEGKPLSFRWSPLLGDQPGALFWMMNSSPAIDFQQDALFALTFFREQDSATLIREFRLPPHGFLVVSLDSDHELHAFLGNTIGWVTVQATNPYTTTYYFAQNPSGFVGGDHGF